MPVLLFHAHDGIAFRGFYDGCFRCVRYIVQSRFVDSDVSDLAAVGTGGRNDIDVYPGLRAISVRIPDGNSETVLTFSCIRGGMVRVRSISMEAQGSVLSGNVVSSF